MRKGFLAVFSGFPDHHFSEEITKRLREELTVRKSIVFISACPLEYGQNDDDSDGMHEIILGNALRSYRDPGAYPQRVFQRLKRRGARGRRQDRVQ